MRRTLLPAVVLPAGFVLLVDYLVVNPTLDAVGGFLLRYLVVLAAAAGVAGGVEVGATQVARLREARGDRLGPAVALAGFAAVVAIGFLPGSEGAGEPAMRWLVASLLIPLAASLFSLLFFFMLAAAWRAARLGGREPTIILAAAAAMVVLLLPIGGDLGGTLAAAAGWMLDVPVGAVLRGLLIGVAIATAVTAARILLTTGGEE